MGSSLESLGNHSAALPFFKEALAQPIPSNATINETAFEKLEKALSLIHLKQFTNAGILVDQVLKLRPTVDALNAKGVILLYEKNYEGALNIFNQILATHLNLDSVICNEGIALADLGENVQALKLFNKSISLNPKNADSWYDIGVILDHEGNFTGSFAAYNQAQKLTPHNRDVLWNGGLTLGIVLLKSHDFVDALRVYDTMLRVAPHNPYLLQVRNYAESRLLKSHVGGSSLP